jgi:excinuclease ABC subunit A
VGTVQVPVPEKLIIHPEKPLCDGAMYSPGFFPKGYLCKPYNGGYYVVQAVARRYGFDPSTTPWNKMTAEAQKAFLFGDPEPLNVIFESRKRPPTTRKLVFRGFYGWVGDWDVGGTYTRTSPCLQCNGSGFKPEYLAVKLGSFNVQELGGLSLSRLAQVIDEILVPDVDPYHIESSLHTIRKRLRFLLQVGLGYLSLSQVFGTLSAGEAQRIRLAGLLGSGLTSLTVLVDEPTRGMHPSEVEALVEALLELRNEGNTVIAVEHDPVVIQRADQLIDMGPGAGVNGGKVVAAGAPNEVSRSGTLTAKWLLGERRINVKRKRRTPKGRLTIKGACANNLKGETIQIPLGTLWLEFAESRVLARAPFLSIRLGACWLRETLLQALLMNRLSQVNMTLLMVRLPKPFFSISLGEESEVQASFLTCSSRFFVSSGKARTLRHWGLMKERFLDHAKRAEAAD